MHFGSIWCCCCCCPLPILPRCLSSAMEEKKQEWISPTTIKMLLAFIVKSFNSCKKPRFRSTCVLSALPRCFRCLMLVFLTWRICELHILFLFSSVYNSIATGYSSRSSRFAIRGLTARFIFIRERLVITTDRSNVVPAFILVLMNMDTITPSLHCHTIFFCFWDCHPVPFSRMDKSLPNFVVR